MSNPIVEALKAARQSIRIHRRTLASKDWGVSMPLDDAEASLRTVAAGVESLVAENARLRDALVGHHNATLQAKLSGRTVAEEWGRECDLSGCRALKGDD